MYLWISTSKESPLSTLVRIRVHSLDKLGQIGDFFLNTSMSIEAQFYQHLAEHSTRTGFTPPDLLLIYLTQLLSERVSRVDIIPDPSFAERYLQLYTEYSHAAFKDYADSALFFCSLMPEYGQRRGLNMDYYATLGISTYYALGDLSEDQRYTQLGNWFYHLQKFLSSAIHPDQRLSLIEI